MKATSLRYVNGVSSYRAVYFDCQENHHFRFVVWILVILVAQLFLLLSIHLMVSIICYNFSVGLKLHSLLKFLPFHCNSFCARMCACVREQLMFV